MQTRARAFLFFSLLHHDHDCHFSSNQSPLLFFLFFFSLSSLDLCPLHLLSLPVLFLFGLSLQALLFLPMSFLPWQRRHIGGNT